MPRRQQALASRQIPLRQLQAPPVNIKRTFETFFGQKLPVGASLSGGSRSGLRGQRVGSNGRAHGALERVVVVAVKTPIHPVPRKVHSEMGEERQRLSLEHTTRDLQKVGHCIGQTGVGGAGAES